MEEFVGGVLGCLSAARKGNKKPYNAKNNSHMQWSRELINVTSRPISYIRIRKKQMKKKEIPEIDGPPSPIGPPEIAGWLTVGLDIQPASGAGTCEGVG